MSLFEDAKIMRMEALFNKELFDAFDRTRKRPKIKPKQIPRLKLNGKDLGLFSWPGRIRWAEAFCKIVERYFGCADGRPTTQTLYHFTLVDQNAVVSHTCSNVDIESLKHALCRGLTGLNFLGMIEPGLYSHVSLPDGSNGLKTCVSWHLHVLVWGISSDAKKALVRGLNRSGEYVPMVPGQVGVKSRKVYDLPKIVRYIRKPPTSVYRIGQKRTGSKVYYEQFRSKYPRPGELVTLYMHAQHLRCDQLAVAGGEGSVLLNQILDFIAPSATRHSAKRSVAKNG